jgi:O-antigen/teichoic acid export membrane protein
MVVGYFSLFDLGLGRALTKLVAERLGSDQVSEIPPLIWTALALMSTLGLLGAVSMGAGASWTARWALSVPPQLQRETTASLLLLALTIPVVVVTVALRGILEANQRFGLVNAVRIPMGVFNFLGPVAALAFSPSLVVMIAVLVGGRWVFCLVHFAACWWAVPEQMMPVGARWTLVRPLVGLGGWMTVSNLIGPLMVYLDRFLIGSVLSVGAVTFYVTPYEVITRVSVIPNAFVGVLFPAFATTLVDAPEKAAKMLDKGSRFVFLAVFPITLAAAVLARPGLTLWVGPDFAEKSTSVLQLLSAGVLLNAMAQVPFALLQGAGRADLTARLHLAELPIYLAMLWWAITNHGIAGAAAVWVLRVGADTSLLFWMARSLLGRRRFLIHAGISTGAGLVAIGMGAMLEGGLASVAYLVVMLLALLPVAWQYVLDPEDRQAVRERLKFTSTL